MLKSLLKLLSLFKKPSNGSTKNEPKALKAKPAKKPKSKKKEAK